MALIIAKKSNLIIGRKRMMYRWAHIHSELSLNINI